MTGKSSHRATARSDTDALAAPTAAMRRPRTPPSVVVGIDGSRGAVRAASWAAHEAISRDVPLRMISAVDPRGFRRGAAGSIERGLSFAECAIRYAQKVVEAIDQPVEVETEIVQERPATALLRASASAATVCVGAVGLKRFEHGHLGSTTAALARAALCPVAIVRESEHSTGEPAGWVVVQTDDSPRNVALVSAAVKEAQLRSAPLRAVTCWPSRFPGELGEDVLEETHRRIRAHVSSNLALWKRRYPDVEIQSVAVHGGFRDYLIGNAGSIQLLVAHTDGGLAGERRIGPMANVALDHTDCSVLLVNCQPSDR